MVFDKFLGIKAYHDGSAISEYVNVIPVGHSAIDRLGETRLFAETRPVRGTFVDSLGNIYMVHADEVYKYSADGKSRVRMQGRYANSVIDTFTTRNKTDKVTFCESSIKPTVVYMCDGSYVYQWNTTDPTTAAPSVDAPAWTAAFIIRMMPSPGFIPYFGATSDTDTIPSNVRAFIDDIDMYSVLDTGVYQYAYDDNYGWTSYEPEDLAMLNSICWYDNKLVATEPAKNTVWLTATDPGQFFRYSGELQSNGTQSNWVPNVSQWYFDSTGGAQSRDSNLWHNWYSSTNGADRLNQAIAHAGQLFFLNEGTIEIWSRTGVEDSPIQPNSMSTIYFGARAPVIIANIMYCVCRDTLGHEFIGSISDNFARISTPEIEQRIGNDINELVPVTIRSETFLMVKLKGSLKDPVNSAYVVSREAMWWRWESPANSEFIIQSVNHLLAVSNRGSMMAMNRNSRTLHDGTPILRSIRDVFLHFPGRKILRSVEAVMDTGVGYDGSRGDAYLKVSYDRGHSFGPLWRRALWSGLKNDAVIIWRNLGSGNSMLLELGTSSNIRFQLYQIKFEIA